MIRLGLSASFVVAFLGLGEVVTTMTKASQASNVAASINLPYFIHLCYKPSSGPVEAKLALVGQGLTFDNGG